MLTLYHLPLSFNSRRVWVALLEKQLDFQLIEMKLNGDQFESSFLELNPFHHIPVLVDDGFRVIESLAILDYLEAKYPTPAFLPKDAQSLAIVRMVAMVTVNELSPAMTPLTRKRMDIGEVTPQTIEASKQQIATVLQFLEELLGDLPYFGSEQLTLADFVAGTVVPLLPTMGVSLKDYQGLSKWVKRLRQRESWQQTEPTQETIDAFKTQMRELMAAQKQ